jgi:hypothetical protein
MEIADDCVIRSPDVLEPRRGYEYVAANEGAIAAANQLNKAGTVLVSTILDPDALASGGTVTLYETVNTSSYSRQLGAMPFSAPAGGVRMPFFSANKTYYFMGRYGLIRADIDPDGSRGTTQFIRPAYQPPNWVQPQSGFYWAGSRGNTGSAVAAGWLANNTQVAYRITLCRLGVNGELVESAPSDRFLYTNTSGAAVYPDVEIANGPMVAGITPAVGSGAYSNTTDQFYRLYRSKAVATTADPDDEMFLVAEIIPSRGTLDSYSYCSMSNVQQYVDRTPDTSLYVPLYTNPSTGDGIAQANVGAPVALDAFWFKDRAHYLNTADPHSITIKVIGTGTGGIAAGAWINISGLPRFTFIAPPVGSLGQVQAVTAGTVAANIEATARELVAQINYYCSVSTAPMWTRLIARYISGSSVDAGQIVISRLLPGAAAFTVTTSSRAGWGSDYTTAVSSTNNTQVAGWYWSSLGQPEGVPNSAVIGDATAPAYRGIALRDAAFVLKKDGVWRITDDGDPAVEIVDPTVICAAPWTAVAIGDNVVSLCTTGVVLINEMGAVNISHDAIGRELTTLMAYVGSATLSSVAFAVAREVEHEYILCLPESPNATSCGVQYVFNLETRAWTRWRLPHVTAGVTDPDSGKLYWALARQQTITTYGSSIIRERRAFDSTDYQDPTTSLASPASTATATLTFSGDKTSLIAVGDLVQQIQATYYLQQRVDSISYSSATGNTTVTLDAAPAHAWASPDALTIIKAIQARPKFLPAHMDVPATAKDFATCALAFRYFDLDAFSVDWATELYPPDTATEDNPVAEGTWGPSPWGSTWGRQVRDMLIQVSLKGEYSRSALLTLGMTLPCALTRFELNAIDLKMTGADEKASR